jgi:transcription initiation factor TFIIE subunit alpha
VPRADTIDQLRVFIEKLLDPEARDVFLYMFEAGKEVTENDIAEATKLKINSVRRALNLLAEKGLITYRKVRYVDKNGRPSIMFYWRVNAENLKALVDARKRAVIEKLKMVLEHEESNYYYVCPLDAIRYTMDEAMDYNFTCPRCGSMLVPDEARDHRIEVLRRLIRRLEEEYEREAA